MSRAQQVRDYLAQQNRPCTAAEIVSGIGMTGDVRAHYTIGVLYREGLLERTGEARGYRYRLGRPVQPKISREEARKRRTDRERSRRSHQGKKTWAEHLAQLAERRRQRKATAEQVHRQRLEASQRERAAAKERAQASRAAARASEQSARARGYLYRGGPKAKPATAKAAPAKVQPSARMAPTTSPKPVLQRTESVAEFEARGGRVDRLPGPWERAA